MKKLFLVVAVLGLVSFGLFADEDTISKMDQGDAFYKVGCLVARELFGTNTGAEFDKLGNLKDEFNVEKQVTDAVIKGVEWVAEKVEKSVTEFGAREAEKAKNNQPSKSLYSNSNFEKF